MPAGEHYLYGGLPGLLGLLGDPGGLYVGSLGQEIPGSLEDAVPGAAVTWWAVLLMVGYSLYAGTDSVLCW